MSIVIPSKNIYNLENQKVKKNRIKGTSTTITNVSKKSEELKKVSFNPYIEETSLVSKLGYLLYSKNYESMASNNGVSAIEGNEKDDGDVHYKGYRFKISSDSYVIKDTIKATVSLTYREGEGYTKDLVRGIPALKVNENLQDGKTSSVTVTIGETKKIFSKADGIDAGGENSIKIKTEFYKFDGDRDKEFSFDIYFPIYCFSIYKSDENQVNAFGVTNISVSIQSDSYDLSNQVSVSYGTDPVIDISSNELFQNNVKYNGINIATAISQKIISKYLNGKETVDILCSISDYYDENGEKKISIDGDLKNMMFSIGDKVVPMTLGKDGNDKPISYYPNGEKKEFVVCGIKPFYDGAVWQELTLQEV